MAKPDVEIPPVRYRRGKRPLLKRLVHPIRAPFAEVLGGPNLDDCIHHQVDCGSLEIEFFRPRAAIGAGDNYPRQVFLHDDAVFGRDDCERRTQHRFLNLGVSNWGYRPPKLTLEKLLPIPREAYVIVTASWRLERVKNGIQLEVDNTAMLEQYLRDDYFAYLESEGGHNWKVRKEVTEELGPGGRGWTQPEVDEVIESKLHATPSSYEAIIFNDKPWLRYNWTPTQNYPKSLIYSCTLTPNTLLTVHFHLTQMTGGSLKHWWSPLVEDTEILMQGLKVHYKDLPSK